MEIVTSMVKRTWFLLLVGFIAGAVVILGIRAAIYKAPAGVHYHANFAAYINGQREQFSAPNYYEETAMSTCSVSEAAQPELSPMSRAHMHQNVNSVVHVEDKLVTWGNFFTVLGWSVGNDYLGTRDGLYQTNGQSKVTYVLNGKTVNTIANLVIGDQDTLLVNYGDQSADVIHQEYAAIQNNALKADQSKDPASCGSHENTVTIQDRLQHLF